MLWKRARSVEVGIPSTLAKSPFKSRTFAALRKRSITWRVSPCPLPFGEGEGRRAKGEGESAKREAWSAMCPTLIDLPLSLLTLRPSLSALCPLPPASCLLPPASWLLPSALRASVPLRLSLLAANRIFLCRCAEGSREMPMWSTSSILTPAARRQYWIDCVGNPAQCLIRLNRSSSTAAINSPSRTIAAAASPW